MALEVLVMSVGDEGGSDGQKLLSAGCGEKNVNLIPFTYYIDFKL